MANVIKVALPHGTDGILFWTGGRIKNSLFETADQGAILAVEEFELHGAGEMSVDLYDGAILLIGRNKAKKQTIQEVQSFDPTKDELVLWDQMHTKTTKYSCRKLSMVAGRITGVCTSCDNHDARRSAWIARMKEKGYDFDHLPDGGYSFNAKGA